MAPQFDSSLHGDIPHFTYQGVMPTLNEYLGAMGRHPQAGGRMKRDLMMAMSCSIRSDLKLWQTDKPVILHYIIHEPNMKRDHDNAFCVASKVTQDALQKCGVIPNDGWANVVNFTHDFYVDRQNPRIEVYIEEVEDA